MKYLRFFVVAGIGLSLILNFRLLTKLDNLETRMNALSNYQSQLMSSVNSQTGNVRNVLEEMKREQSWISPIKLDLDSSQIESRKASLNFSWQVKELKNNSKVLFNYRLPNTTEFQSIAAKELHNGYFQVVVPLQVDVAPQWQVYVSDSNPDHRAVQEEAKRILEEEKAKSYQNSAMSYYVSVVNAGMTKSSEIAVSPTHNLSALLYSPVDVNIHINDRNQRSLNVSITEIMPDRPTKIEQIYLQRYQGSRLLSQERLTSDGRAFFNQSKQTKEIFNRLVVKLIYENGDSFTKEVYNQV